MKRVRISSVFADYWRMGLASFLGIVFLLALLLFRLGSITPGLAPAEVQSRADAKSSSAIIENPLNIHQKAAQNLAESTNHRGAVAHRLPSAFFGFVAVICFFLILRGWHTRRVSFAATSLFATSSWFLHTARLASYDISYVMTVTLLLGALWLHSERHVKLATIITLVSALLLIYVPGMIWLVVPAIIWQRKIMRRTLGHFSMWGQAMLVTISVVGLGLLVLALIESPSLILLWLGLPDSLPTVGLFIQELVNIPLSLLVVTQPDPILHLGRLPLLDAFTAALVILGGFAYIFRLSLDRTRLVFGLIILGSLLVALRGAIPLSFLLVPTYMLVAAGIALLLQQWFTIFPRNPFARSVGLTIMASAIILTSFYHTTRYFRAWAGAPETKAAFQHKPDITDHP